MARQIQSGDTLGVPTAGHPAFGTIGVGVIDAWGRTYAMSCTHVVAAPDNPNSFRRPAESPSAPGLPVGANVVGQVFDWINIGPGTNYADAGLILLDPAAAVVTNATLGMAAGQNAIYLQASDYASFAGRQVTVFTSRGPVAATAGLVYNGVVFTLNRTDFTFSSVLSYTASSGGLQGGDSGAAVVDSASGQFLGLHMGGPGGGLGYCTIAPLIWQDFQAYAFAFAQ
jgi:hypothetical protein